MKKKNRTNAGYFFGVVLVIAVVALAVMYGDNAKSVIGGGADDGTASTGTVDLSACPDDGDSTFAVNLFNSENDATSENYDATYYLTSDGGDFQTDTDTTTPTALTVNCGESYKLCLVSGNAEAGDTSNIDGVLVGEGATITDDGCVAFTPLKSNYNLRITAPQFGHLDAKVYDNDAAGWACNTDDSCSDFENITGAVEFESIVNNTAKAVGIGGYLDYTISVRANSVDEAFGNNGVLLLVEAPVATWNTPVVKVDGKTLTDMKGSLTPEEEKQFSAYEYIYLYEGVIDYSGVKVDLYMDALAGVNPSTDPQLDFAARGRYLSLDGVTTKEGAADDTATSAVVYTVNDITFDIS